MMRWMTWPTLALIIGLQFTQETRVNNALDDVASNICKAAPRLAAVTLEQQHLRAPAPPLVHTLRSGPLRTSILSVPNQS